VGPLEDTVVVSLEGSLAEWRAAHLAVVAATVQVAAGKEVLDSEAEAAGSVDLAALLVVLRVEAKAEEQEDCCKHW